MKTLPDGMKERLNLETTTLCRCWILKRQDGLELGFTDHDEAITINGIKCDAATGVDAGEVSASLGLNVDNQEIAGALSSLSISEGDIAKGLYDHARLEAYMVDWEKPHLQFLDATYLIGEIERQDAHFKVELRSLTALLDQSVGRHFSRNCSTDLGSPTCGVDLSSPGFQTTGTVSRIRGAVLFETASLANFNEAWFRGGRLEVTSGANAGQSVEIADHYFENETVLLSLWQPLAEPLEVGDQFTIRVGCNKTFETCKNKFANHLNFQGFPHLPGNDFAVSYASNSEKMDGGPLIP